LTIAS